MNHMKRIAAALGCVGALALSTVGQSHAQSAELIEAAKQEGRIVFYSSTPDATNEALVKAFKEAYPGIDVQWIRMVSSALFARFTGEVESGVNNVDFLISGSQELYQKQPELFQVITDIEGLDKATVKAKNDHYMVPSATPHLITYNTDLVSKEDLEKHFATWEGAADPFWKGKTALTDPRATTNVLSFFKLLDETYGDKILEGIAAQQPSYFDSGTPATQQVAAGAFALAYPTGKTHSAQVRAQGAPLAFHQPAGPAHGLETAFAIVKEPKNPNAAKLFATWLISPEGGQKIYCSIGNFPAVPSDNPDCQLSPEHVGSVDVIEPDVSARVLKLLGL